MLDKELEIRDIVDFVMAANSNTNLIDDYDYLDFSEVKALEDLLNIKTSNIFPAINQQQLDLNLGMMQIPGLELQIEQMKAQIAGRDYGLLKAYEDNEANIKNLDARIAEMTAEIAKIAKRLHAYDIQISQEPDPKYNIVTGKQIGRAHV